MMSSARIAVAATTARPILTSSKSRSPRVDCTPVRGIAKTTVWLLKESSAQFVTWYWETPAVPPTV